MRNSVRRGGFTLVELILAIVILGVGLAGVLSVFQQTTRHSADPLVQRQLLAIAEGMLEEVMSRPFSSGLSAAPSGCARDGLYQVDHYNGYDQPVCEIDGTAVASLPGYRVKVQVNAEAWQGVPSDKALRITVTASRGSESLQLVSWRTAYAP